MDSQLDINAQTIRKLSLSDLVRLGRDQGVAVSTILRGAGL